MRRWFEKATRGGVPWGLIGMIGLVVLAERFVSRRAMDFLDVDDWAYRRGGQTASRDAGRYDVLIFGDSLAKLGVIPRVVGERTGWRARNLAISGSQAPATYVLLKRALASGARPAAVVVDFFPPLLRVGPRHNLGRWAMLLTPLEAAQLAWWAGDADLFGPAALGRLLPSLRSRAGVRATLLAALAGSTDSRLYYNVLFFRNWGRNDGAQLMAPQTRVGELSATRLDDLQRAFFPVWDCHPANARAIEAFLALAASADVPVYWVLPPLWPAIHERLARTGFDAGHEAFVRSWQARFPNLVVLDARGELTDPLAFMDVNHVSAEGAYALSVGIGDALKRGRVPANLPPTRWVALSAERSRPVPEWVEDIEESRVALEALWRSNRK
jgi:hypothetical protein